MMANYIRLVIAHGVLALASASVFWARPNVSAAHAHMRPRAIAFVLFLQAFAAITPYLLSGCYACNILPERGTKATVAFIVLAVGIAIIATGLNRHLFGLNVSPPPLLVLGGLTLALIIGARLCAFMGRNDIAQWENRP
jgi:hypothetical protein